MAFWVFWGNWGNDFRENFSKISKKDLKTLQIESIICFMVYELLQKELREASESRYAISKATGINEAVLCKIYNNNQSGLWLTTAETLLDYFGYEIVKKGQE